MKVIGSPLGERDIRSLKLGEQVLFNGDMITGRDEMHIRALSLARGGGDVPREILGSVLFHCGPIMRRSGEGWEVVAAGPTTSSRMDSLEPEMISRFGIRAIIGKGGMSREVSEAMAATGCVYLAATGGAAVSLAEGIKKVTGVEWEDLGMAEAMWKLKAERFGPLTVAMDSSGGSLYENVRLSLRR
ncbi:MAG: FumA C-terminus/TtdB family hydratase beta subunit [Candidatus Methanomethylophilaceae archaeon]|nr:FumA C-terminus/TtdB family hydratase beta subunit [Candidatus Methanomethylophilaceae archaeon]